MKRLLFVSLIIIAVCTQAQVTGIAPAQAHQGDRLSTTITSSGLFQTGSSPQGNIQDILLRNINDSVYAISDSTLVSNSNLATTFWNMPASLTTGIYDLVVRIYNTVTLTITDYVLSSIFTINQGLSVWPGDANDDHAVDNTDLLALGLGYGSTGPARTGASITWTGQTANDWLQIFTNYTPNVNYKYADCNGDGVINANDTVAILQNFYLTHAKTGPDSINRSGVPDISVSMSKDTLQAGDTMAVTFTLGSALMDISGLYGIAFTYNYNAAYFDSTYTAIRFPDSWLGTSADKILLSKISGATGKVQAAVTRIDHTARSGNGPIGVAYFKITTDNISGLSAGHYADPGYITDVTAIDINGNTIALNTVADTATIKYLPNGIKELSNIAVRILPIPASDLISITAENSMTEIEIMGADGRGLSCVPINNTKITHLDISSYANGLYLIRVKTVNGSGIAKLLINK